MATSEHGPMTDMVQAISRLPEPEREQIIRDRLELFAEQGDEERRAAMGDMISAVLKDLGPEAMQNDIVMVKQIIPQLSPDKQQAANVMLSQMSAPGM